LEFKKKIPYLYTKNGWPRLVKSRSEAEVVFFFDFLTTDYLKRHSDRRLVEKIGREETVFVFSVDCIFEIFNLKFFTFFLLRVSNPFLNLKTEIPILYSKHESTHWFPWQRIKKNRSKWLTYFVRINMIWCEQIFMQIDSLFCIYLWIYYCRTVESFSERFYMNFTFVKILETWQFGIIFKLIRHTYFFCFGREFGFVDFMNFWKMLILSKKKIV
jgi:hypothetical protein